MQRKKSQRKKAKKDENNKVLEEFSNKLTQSMVTNLSHNLENPEEFEKHEAETEKALDKVMKKP